MVKVAFDIDGCLIDYFGEPQQDIIELIKYFFSTGCKVYVWTGGGIDYAKSRIAQLKLEHLVIPAVKKSFVPDIAFDDEQVSLGKINIRVHPNTENLPSRKP